MGAREDARKRLVVETVRCSGAGRIKFNLAKDSDQPNKNCSNYSTADVSFAEWLDDAVMYGAKYANERAIERRTNTMDNVFEYGQDVVHGYKAFAADWTCLFKRYTCPGIFHEDGPISVCERGMHFCEDLHSVFSFYEYTPEIHVCEVIGMGQVERSSDNSKCCCTDLVVVRELTHDEIIANTNLYSDNKGVNNTGQENTGNWNTGKQNEGHRNTGDHNTGDYNTGEQNVGSKNTGRFNIGSYNTGEQNIGNYNTGSFNLGDNHVGWFNTKEEPLYMFNRPVPNLDAKDRAVLQYFDKTIAMRGPAWRQEWWDECCSIRNEVVSLPNFDPGIFKECTGIDARKKVIEVATCTKIRQDATIADGYFATMKFPDGHEIEMLVDGYKADQKEISVWVK